LLHIIRIYSEIEWDEESQLLIYLTAAKTINLRATNESDKSLNGINSIQGLVKKIGISYAGSGERYSWQHTMIIWKFDDEPEHYYKNTQYTSYVPSMFTIGLVHK